MKKKQTFTAALPQVPEFRRHIEMTLHFVNTFMMMAEVRNFPAMGIEKLVTKAQALELHGRIKEAGNEPVDLSTEDLLTVYASHNIANIILVSEYGEIMADEILKRVSEGHHLKTFKAYRQYCITCNNHMIKDIEIKMPNLDGLAELKEKLRMLNI